MVKSARELLPGDVINLGGGTQMIVATMQGDNKLAIICDCGQVAALHHDCKIYVYCNRDEERARAIEAERKQVEKQRERALAERARREAERARREKYFNDTSGIWD